MAASFGFLLPLSIVLARNFKEYNPLVRSMRLGSTLQQRHNVQLCHMLTRSQALTD